MKCNIVFTALNIIGKISNAGIAFRRFPVPLFVISGKIIFAFESQANLTVLFDISVP